ncbi:MAG: protein kinase [Anaerolineaceae bacterium]|nr:protein kinase [Anaerolineaceae bacterium]
MANLTGKTLGKYEINDRLGKGGMAEVYKAYHPRLDTHVAIKVLYSHLIDEDNFLTRFEREARSVASLRHTNIVRIFDFDVEDETYFMVMDFIDGPPLNKFLSEIHQKGEHLSRDFILKLFQQISAALDYAHSQGMIHRDVKTANILLDSQKNAFLADFGIAHIVSHTQFTATGTLIGTPAYMSPEQCQGLSLTTSSDIYSLGILLYEMLVGHTPFDQDTPMVVIHKQIYEPLPKPSQINPEISPALEAVIMKALKKKPEERYQSAGEMAAALKSAIQTDSPPEIEAVPQTEIFIPSELPSDSQIEAISDSEAETDIAEVETIAMLEPIEDPAPKEELTPEGTSLTEASPSDSAQMKAAAETLVESSAMENKSKIAPPAIRPAQSDENLVENLMRPARPKLNIPIGTLIGILAAIVVLILLLIFIPPLISGESQPAAEIPAEQSDDKMMESEDIVPEDAEEPICPNPGECFALADEFWQDGNLEGALESFATVAIYTSDEEQPMYAWTRCEMGELSLGMDRIDEAHIHFIECMEWTHGIEEQQELRDYAQERIDAIEQGNP